MKKQDNILRFDNLSQFKTLIHGFSTRSFGSMRPTHAGYTNSLKKFTHALGTSPEKLVRMDQVHGNTVAEVTKENRGQVVAKTDGLFTHEQSVSLGVLTADCVPVLFYDTKKNYIAAIHAGWRGLFSEILKEAVNKMVKKGSKPEDFVVGIGPCIRVCCYDIAKEHAEKLLATFPDWKPYIRKREGKLFLDLPAVAKQQLSSLGILPDNIEDGDYCTFMHEDIYSCRREGGDFGLTMGVIGQV